MTTASSRDDMGHHWKEADRVAEYVERTDRQAEERAAIFSLVAKLIPAEPDAAIRILDVGSGHGPVAAACLDAFPNAHAIGLDISDAMMEVGRQRMARFGDRFRYVLGDLAGGLLPPEAVELGPFDVVVSARAIHHLPAAKMATLYASIHDALNPGGAFFNIDTASPETPFMSEMFRKASRLENPGRQRASTPERTPDEQRAHDAMLHHRDATLLKHIEWLKAAGFTSVDCFWKRLSMAVVGGYKAR